jgi:DNA-binding transcriptional LysR family regulator
VDFANFYLTEIISEFSNAFPKIRFDFDLTPRLVDLVAEPFDVAIRMGEPEDSALIARPLAQLNPVLFASPDYLRKHGTPAEPRDLVRHECILMPRTRIWRLSNGAGTVEAEVQGRLTLNSNSMIRGLAELGQGIAMMPEKIAADQLAGGQLVRVLPEWQGVPIAVYAVTETRLLPAKTQRFIEFLRDRLKQS